MGGDRVVGGEGTSSGVAVGCGGAAVGCVGAAKELLEGGYRGAVGRPWGWPRADVELDEGCHRAAIGLP